MRTPKYVVDLDKFKKNCESVMLPFNYEWNGNVEFGYSVKTNRDPKLIQYAYNCLDWDIEVVSPDEYRYCVELGIPKERIILNGPCKNELLNEIKILSGVINLDHYKEVVDFAAQHKNYSGLVGLRINFDLESVCPNETTAGTEVSRFGIDCETDIFFECLDILKNNGIHNVGLHMHCSTVTRSLKVFEALANKAVELKERAHFDFAFIDMGGGFFGGRDVCGKPKMAEYAKAICNILKNAFNPHKTKLILEPGASVLATCVTYETSIINERIIRGVKVLTIDGTLLHINPLMQDRNQPFEVLNEKYRERDIIEKQIIGGATCMENDRLASLVNKFELCVGDILSFKYVGAYTMGFNSYFILDPPHVKYMEENN